MKRLVAAVTLLCLLVPGTVQATTFQQMLVLAALERTRHQVSYNGAYYALVYPNEDMVSNFAAYPSKRIWGLNFTDRNIDHRRVPNLQTFFRRHGESFPVSHRPADYAPGDMVTWVLPGNLPHIGIVTDRKVEGSDTPLIVHNIGAGPELEDMLFDYEITGHYRYPPSAATGSTRQDITRSR